MEEELRVGFRVDSRTLHVTFRPPRYPLGEPMRGRAGRVCLVPCLGEMYTRYILYAMRNIDIINCLSLRLQPFYTFLSDAAIGWPCMLVLHHFLLGGRDYTLSPTRDRKTRCQR